MTADRIALLVPSRGRPGQLALMWRSATETAEYPGRVQLLLALDNDDPDRDTYVDWAHQEMGQDLAQSTDPRVIYNLGERRLLAEYWNTLCGLSDSAIYFHGNDDVIFRSYGWDEYVRAGFATWPDRIGCVHGDDGIHHAGMATLGFYSAEWVNALGYFGPPIFGCDYTDRWLSEAADAIGRRYYDPRIFIEHMHPVVGKGPLDQTHRERLTHQAEADATWATTGPERAADVVKLHQAIWAYESAHRIEQVTRGNDGG